MARHIARNANAYIHNIGIGSMKSLIRTGAAMNAAIPEIVIMTDVTFSVNINAAFTRSKRPHRSLPGNRHVSLSYSKINDEYEHKEPSDNGHGATAASPYTAALTLRVLSRRWPGPACKKRGKPFLKILR